MKPVTWGIIGCGNVCEKKSGPAFYKIDGSRLKWVMRRDAEKAGDFARRHGVSNFTDDTNKILSDPDVDIVYIATPPGSHCEYALQVAQAGKHCYVEKPMARNATEAQQMVQAFADRELKLYAGYYRRCLPVFVKARSLFDSGAIGQLTGIVHRHTSPLHRRNDGWRLDAEQSGGGLFMDLASHVFDALDLITGPFQNVRGLAMNVATEADVEDCVSVVWSAPSGALGSSVWNFASDSAEEFIELLGTEGSIRWSAFSGDQLTLKKGKEIQQFSAPYPEHVHQPLVQTIVDELHGKGACPSTGESALRTQIVLDQCLDSYYGGRSDAFWNRTSTWPGRRKLIRHAVQTLPS